MITKGFLSQSIIEIELGKNYKTLPAIEGFSSTKVRQLLNRIVGHPDCKNYLEIGVHLGSTFIPAIYGNEVNATCIDNWIRFGNRRTQFENNLAVHVPDAKINMIEADCWTVDLAKVIQPVDVYFFDGEHHYDDQYKAFTYYNPVLSERFVALVDDYNWSEPRDATQKAFKDLGYNVIVDWFLHGDYNGSEKGWWNGLYVALVEK